MDMKQILSLLVVVVFLASSIGFGVYLGSNGNDSQQPKDAGPQIIDSEQPEVFIATDLNSTIKELVPTMIIAGTTKEFDKVLLEEKILSISGVANVNSEYRQQPGSEFTQGSLAYVANVNVDESIASKKEIFQKILEKIPDFEVVENYSYAVIQIPQEVKLLSEENSDKEFNYTFQTPFIQGLVNLSSKIGDNILVEAQTVFKGTQIIQAIAVEKKNITRQPEVIYLQAEVELLELKNELSLVAQKPFPTIDLNKVRDEINSLEIVESNEIQVNDSGIIVLTLKDADEGKIKAIGNVFEQIPEINFTGIDRDEAKKEYYIQIDFNKQSDFNFLVNSIDSVIASNGFTKDVDYLQVLPVITYVSNIKTTTPKITEENRQQIKEKLSIFDSKIFVLKQKAYIDVNSLNLGDRIDEIIDSVEKIEGIVNLGHIQGDKIQANIDFIRIINQASNIRFEEIDVEE